MKKFTLMMAAAAFLFAACDSEKEVPVVEVTMSSFGFYAGTNAGVLKSDIEVENPSTDISIVLPYGVPEDALKTLVPSFEVTEGAVVTVDDVVVESGVTAVDFSYPVEFLVTVNEKSNAQYIVRVAIAGPASFNLTAAGANADSLYKGPFMAISPSDGIPYLAAVADASVSDQYYPVLYKFDGSLSKVCTVAEVRADQPTIGFSPAGDLVYAFYNYVNKFANVYSVSGGSASLLGEDNLLYRPLTNSGYPTIGVLPLSASQLYVAYGVSAASGSLAKRTLNLCLWNGSSWTQENPIAGREAGDYAYEVFTKLVGDEQYLMIFNQNDQSLSLYKIGAQSVSTVFERLRFYLDEEGTTQAKINLYGVRMDIASDGTPYILAGVEASSTTGSGYSPAVYRYDLETRTVSLVGGVLSSLDVQTSKTFALALDANDVPYLAYADGTTKVLTVTYIDSKTKTWSTPAAISAGEVDNIMMAFAPDGTGYISCVADDAAGNSYINLYSTK
ncbi:MAG: hypothetical protein ACI3Z0_07265 [Candidatus Cryptobacteroides sp.]